MLDPALMEAFDFTPAELAANKQGQLTPAHAARLRKRLAERTQVEGGVLLLTGILSMIIGLGFVKHLIAACPGVFVMLISLPVYGVGYYRMQSDLQRGQLKSICGQLHPYTRRVKGGVDYHIRIGRVSFPVEQEQYNLFLPEMADMGFCFYYLPRTHLLVSVCTQS